MKRTPFVVLATLFGIGLAACDTPGEPATEDLEDAVSLSVIGGAGSWSEMGSAQSPQLAPNSSTSSFRVKSGGEGVTIATSRADFKAKLQAAAGLDLVIRSEDFENPNNPFIGICTGPIDHLTNDDCYLAGEIQEGISVDNRNAGNDPLGGMVSIAGGIFTPTTVVGPNFFVDGTDLRIRYGGGKAVFFSLYAPFHGPCFLLTSVYGPPGLLGVFVITTGAGSSPASYGVIADDRITRITFDQPDFCGELLDDVVVFYP